MKHKRSFGKMKSVINDDSLYVEIGQTPHEEPQAIHEKEASFFCVKAKNYFTLNW